MRILLLAFQLFSFSAFSAVMFPNHSLQYGLVFWGTLNEGTGSTLADSSGTATTAYATNSPVWTNGVIGKALVFNPSGTANQTVGIGSGTNTALNVASVTVALWVQFAPTNASQVLVDNQSTSPYCGFALQTVNGQLYWEAAYNRNTTDCIATNYYTLGTWYHFAATYDAANLIIYVNGVMSKTTAATGSINYTNAAQPKLAMRSGASTGAFKGALDDVRIYSRALTASEILQLYGGGRGAH